MNLLKLNTPLAGIITSLILLGCGGGGGSSSEPLTNVEPMIESSSEPTTSTSNIVQVQTTESNITENSATVKWIENDYTMEILEYGTNGNYDLKLLIQEVGIINYKKNLDSQPTKKNIIVTISDLDADTTYNYRIVGKKNDKKVVSNNKTFTTSEPIPEETITPEPAVESTPLQEVVEPTPEPTVEETPEPVVEPTPEPVIVETPLPIIEPTPEPTIEETPEPVVEPTPEPVIVETPLPIIEPTPEPTIEEVPQPVVEPTPEPAVVETPEPIIEEIPESISDPAPEPTIEEVPQPVVEPTPEPAVEEVPEPVIEETPLPVIEPTPKPTIEETPEPVVEPTPEPVIVETPLPIIEPTPEPTIEEVPQPVVEPTPEPAVVETPEPIIEEIPESISDPAPEPTIEKTPEPVVEPILDPLVEPVPEAEYGDIAEHVMPISVCKSGPAIQKGQIKDSTSGNGMEGVTITIDGCSTKTNQQGFYTLKNIAENDIAIVTINSKNSYPHSTMIQITEYSAGSTRQAENYLEYIIDTYDLNVNYHSETEHHIKTSTNAGVKLSASAYIDSNTNQYVGVVNAKFSYQNVSTDIGKTVFPGAFEGKNSNGVTVPFISYGFIAMNIVDNLGNTLNTNKSSNITFPPVNGSSDDILPLWYYDYPKGIWIEDGYAQRQNDGSYEGLISHIGTWSLSKPIEYEPGIYRGRVTYENGNVVKDARMSIIGKNWIQKDLSTDSDGIFEIKVIPGEDFQLSAYNFKWKYEAKYNGLIQAVASGEIVEDRL